MKLFGASKMHIILKTCGITVMFLVLLTSCEKCWECSYETTIVSPDSNTTQTITNTTCLEDEKQGLEDLGHHCVQQ